jgi:hypothetical protein
MLLFGENLTLLQRWCAMHISKQKQIKVEKKKNVHDSCSCGLMMRTRVLQKRNRGFLET